MKKYEIEINNEIYRVSVKELPEDADMASAQTTSNAETKKPPTQEPPKESVESQHGTTVNAPMAGTILNINVSPGQKILEGDTLIILEAMKMENEIVAPTDGVVGEIHVNINDRVESGQVLLTL